MSAQPWTSPYATLADMPVPERVAWTNAEMDRLREWCEAEHRRVVASRKGVEQRYGKDDALYVLAARNLEVSNQHAWRMMRVMSLTHAANAAVQPLSPEWAERAEEDWRHHATHYADPGRFSRYPADALWTDEQRQMAYYRADQRAVGEMRAVPT